VNTKGVNKVSAQKIYGDEAGFTGENMLDDQQPYFCYTTVAIDETEAEKIISELRDKYHFQNGSELKGKTVYKRRDNLRIIEDLLSKVNKRFKTTIDDKRFTVCCRLFEYIYEPVLAANSSIFYSNFFHLMIANSFYLSYTARNEFAVKLFNDTYNYLRWGSIDNLEILFKKEYIEKATYPIKYFLRFAYKYRDIILEEFKLKEEGNKIITPDWLLDLTLTKINLMLGMWGEEYEQLEVYLDNSKPLFSEISMMCFDAMVNRKGNPVYMEFGGKRDIITYNLVRRPNLISSDESYGIQIADLLSSMFIKSALNAKFKKDEKSITSFKLFLENIDNRGFIFPDIKYIQYDKYPLSFVNVQVFRQIDEWIMEGKHPLLDVVDFYNLVISGVLNRPPEDLQENFSKYNSYQDMLDDFEIS